MKHSWLETTRYVRNAEWEEARSWHDTIWLMIPILAILLSGPLWFFRLVDLDMGSLSWSLFGYTLVRELLNWRMKRVQSNGATLAVTLAGDVLGIFLLGLLWHFSHTVDNPLFLVVFLVPIIAGALIYSSLVTFWLAGLSITAVFAVALTDIPHLRGAFLQTALVPAWLAAYITRAGTETANLVGDYSASNAFSIVLAFAFGCVITAAIADRLCLYFVEVLENRPKELAPVPEDRRPTFLIDRETFLVTSGNKAFQEYCLAGTSPVLSLPSPDGSGMTVESGAGQRLFDCIRFDEEAEVRQMIIAGGGSTVCHYHIGPESRVGHLHAQIAANGEQCELILEDLSAELYLRTTLDILENAVILLGENLKILYFNSAARRLFPSLANGVEASAALQLETLGSPWWELGEMSRQSRTLNINGRKYHTACSATQLPKQDDRIFVLSLTEA